MIVRDKKSFSTSLKYIEEIIYVISPSKGCQILVLTQPVTLETMDFSKLITTVPHFPKEGVYFRHIGPLLKNREAFQEAVKEMLTKIPSSVLNSIDYVAGLDARGFIFATSIQLLSSQNLSQVMLRKKSKLPGETLSESYGLEYGKSELEIEVGSIPEGARVLIVDDLLASGGTMCAAGNLIQKAGAIPACFLTLIELEGLEGRSLLEKKHPDSVVVSLLKYPAASDSAPRSFKKPVEYHPIDHFEEIASILVMSHPTLDAIADRMALREGMERSHVNWSKFPDGWPNITFEPSSVLMNRHMVFLFNVSRMDIFAEQLSLLVALPRQLIQSLTVVIPYLGPATHERVDRSGVLATVEPILKIISSSIPSTRSGPAVLRIYDIHALQIRFYPTDNVITKLSTFVPLFKEYVEDDLKLSLTQGKDRPAIAFPDDGAYKRFKHMFEPNYKIVVCSKVRDGDSRKVVIKDFYGFPAGQEGFSGKVFIVDDLVQSGGTMIECSKALRVAGFEQIYAYVSHAVFPKGSYKRITKDLFDGFIVTSSNPEVTSILEHREPFEVLGVSRHICKEIYAQLDLDYRGCLRHMKQIYVSSTNSDKLRAVYNHFGPNVRVYGVAVDSEVPEQPIGHVQTVEGAFNRLRNLEEYLREHRLKTDILVSIENGIDSSDGRYYDFPVVLIDDGSGMKIKVSPDSRVMIPKEYEKYVENSMGSEQSRTFGSLMCEDLGITDWYGFVGADRCGLIERSLRVSALPS